MEKRKVKDATLTSGHGESGGGSVRVRFELPATVSATTVSVCGDFNGWQAEGQPLTRLDDGRFRTDIVLSGGERYRFRYLLDGERWENDPAADDYVPNRFGTEDSVVDLTDTRSLPVIDATSQPGPGLRRLRIRQETWERIEAEAAACGIVPEEFMARLLDAAMASRERPTQP